MLFAPWPYTSPGQNFDETHKKSFSEIYWYGGNVMSPHSQYTGLWWSWMMTWRRKNFGHWQHCYWHISPGIFQWHHHKRVILFQVYNFGGIVTDISLQEYSNGTIISGLFCFKFITFNVRKHAFMCRGPLYKHGLTLIPTMTGNHKPSKVWDEITYPFPNFNGLGLDE